MRANHLFNSWLTKKKIAHRGLHNSSKNIPENSMKAFELAIQKGYAIEFDVQADLQGTPIVFHDSNTNRMTGENYFLKTSKYTYFKNLKLNKTDQKIPSLQEVLEFIDGQTPIILEIKNTDFTGKHEKKIKKMLESYKGEFAIKSFNPYIVSWFKINMPNSIVGQVSSFFQNSNNISKVSKFFIKSMIFNKQVKPDFISYDINNIPNKYIFKNSNIPILTWTVNTKEKLQKALKYCDNIIFEDIYN